MKLTKSQLIHGFTLLETLIVVMIVALVATMIIWPFASFRNGKLLDGAIEDITTFLNEARARTLSSEDASQYGVFFESGRIILFKGTTFSDGDPNNKELLIDQRLTITVDSAAIGNNGVIFKRLTGGTDQSGQVTVKLIDDWNQNRVISISSAGIISFEKGLLFTGPHGTPIPG